MIEQREYLPFGRPDFSGGEIAAVTQVLQTGWVGMGPETLAFESELAQSVRAPHVVTVNSCTSALTLSLLVSGVGPGDEVICPSLTWCSTANAALYLGAKPVFCDIDPNSFCITEQAIAEKITKRTRAIIVVHFGGLAADTRSLRKAIPSNIAIIEDAAHAIGSAYDDGVPVGGSGNATCFSFYANKNLSTGEGGAIALFDESIASRLCSLRQHGLVADAWKRFTHPKSILTADLLELGYKMNYTDLQACIGRVQLRRLEEFSAKRMAIAKLYCENLTGENTGLRFQSGVLSKGHARHLFTVTLPVEKMTLSRDEFVIALRERKIGASIHYAALHGLHFYEELGEQPALVNTEFICKRIVTLPISASMTLEDAGYVVAQFNEVLRGCLK